MCIKTIALIGYSGYAYVVYDCFFSQGQIVTAYTNETQATQNLFALKYLGDFNHTQVKQDLGSYEYFVSIADNAQRRRVTQELVALLGQPIIALHKTAVLSRNIQSGEGVMIGPRVIVNSASALGDGVILQSGCILEHECRVGDFASVGTGAVLCGGVQVGEGSSIGARTVIIPGVKIGKNVTVAEGLTIRHDIAEGLTVG